jgi:nitroimidazol reductase NimA-like FMN-containing flavoprotein (pyridoxamine 5'-phosphate oxidase superfamily)
MKGQLRRKDRAISAERAMQILSRGEFGVLSTVDAENQPYGVPVNYVLVNNCIEFHCATSGHKIDNINYNDKVSFCVVGETQVLPAEFSTAYESVIVFGAISELTGSAKRDSLVFLIAKYSPDRMEAGMEYIERLIAQTSVYSIAISEMTGKANR